MVAEHDDSSDHEEVESPSPTSDMIKSDGSDSRTDSEGDGDADEEPALKYERLGGDVPQLLEKDTVSTIAVWQQHIVSTWPNGTLC